MPREKLSWLPRNVFEWCRVFGDDLGYEPNVQPSPVDYFPGSSQKIATLAERVSRGQSIWHSGDRGSLGGDDGIKFRVAGDRSRGAVVCRDDSGHPHRIAIWTEIETRLARRCKMLYVPACTSHVDDFEKNEQLRAIRKHAAMNNASFVAVASLFSARCSSESEFRKLEYPFVVIALQWIRWLAKYVDKVVICWGEENRFSRDLDVLWLLSRTSRNCQVYAMEKSGPPPEITSRTATTLRRYDCKLEIFSREGIDVDLDQYGA